MGGGEAEEVGNSVTEEAATKVEEEEEEEAVVGQGKEKVMLVPCPEPWG